jgi:hypothetical protein
MERPERGVEPRHITLAKKVLHNVEIAAPLYGFTARMRDERNVLLYDKNSGKNWSVYCSGFNAFLDVQLLTDDYSIDKRVEERRVLGSKELMDFVREYR